MRIGVLIDRLNVGGVEKAAIEEVRAFQKNGINATLVVMSRKAIVEDAFTDLLVDIPIEYLEDRLPFFLRGSFRIPFFSFFSFFHLTYPIFLPLVVRNDYDLFLSHNTYTSFTALAISTWRSIPYAVFIYDPIKYIIEKAYPCGPIRWLRPLLLIIANKLDSLIVNNAKAVFVNGELHQKQLRSILRDKSKLVILPLGHSYLEQIPSSRGDYIITVTAWKWGKELELLLEVMKSIKTARLVVAGRWVHFDYQEKINKLIKELEISSQVEIIGGVSESDLNGYYAGARVAVIVNNERGFGMPAMEAAANGCTFVIPSECGVARYFEDKMDGFYFSYGDKDALKEFLLKLLKNERLAYNMGESGWRKVKNDYSWERHAEKILDALSVK